MAKYGRPLLISRALEGWRRHAVRPVEAPDSLFDALARDLASAMSRREALRRFTMGLGAAFLASLRFEGAAWAQSGCTCNGVSIKPWEACCRTVAPERAYYPAIECCTARGVQPRYPIQDLASCPNRASHRGYKAVPNGCGSTGGQQFPNNFLQADFTHCCNAHDLGYSNCTQPKSQTDNAFLTCLRQSCTDAYNQHPDSFPIAQCLLAADGYFGAVVAFGGDAYEATQKEACDCCPGDQSCLPCGAGMTRCPDGTCCSGGCGPDGTCCPGGPWCLDTHGLHCFPTGGYQCAGVCVPIGRECCSTAAGAVACLPRQTCANGQCTGQGCSPGNEDCGGACCSGVCCGGSVCCPTSQECCGAKCCPPGTECRDDGECVPQSPSPATCNGRPCDGNCCGGVTCCPTSQDCCDSGVCCPPGQSCINGRCGTPGGGVNCSGAQCAPGQVCLPYPTGGKPFGNPVCCSDPCSNSTERGPFCCGFSASGVPTKCCPGFGCILVSQACPSGCPAGQTSCGGACVDLMSDIRNCGACGHACPADGYCLNGACHERDCSPGLVGCGRACVDLMTNANHCGACNHGCDFGLSCVNGTCVSAGCPSGQTRCGGVCVDLMSDMRNCGACGHACPTDGFCLNGGCVEIDCVPGLVPCGRVCVDLKTDPNHCGACNQGCDFGLKCVNGTCVSASGGTGGQVTCNGQLCAPGQVCLSGATGGGPPGTPFCCDVACRNNVEQFPFCCSPGAKCCQGFGCIPFDQNCPTPAF